MVERRTFIRALATILVSQARGYEVWAQEQQPQPPSGIGVDPDYDGPLPPLGVLGQDKPTTAERKIAGDILAAAPSGPTPFDVASFFMEIGNGKYSPDWKPYIQGWPVRWNPLIVRLFRETRTDPDRFDDTPWCAAFVNWCYQRASSNVATNSPSSGSFRCFGSETRHPRPGDIVVFKTLGAEDSCIGQGHVGFFVRDLGNKIQVLGGNQVMGRQHHMICSEAIEKKGHRLTLHSYRTEKRLHRTA